MVELSLFGIIRYITDENPFLYGIIDIETDYIVIYYQICVVK